MGGVLTERSETMPHDDRLTSAAIHAAFAQEISAMGGSVSDVFDDGARLFARSVLPRTREVLPKDRVQDGVGLRAAEGSVWVHPYVFRQVCSNGAIIAHALQTRRIDDVDQLEPEEAESAIREAVRACGAEECFTAAADEMRSASEVQADLILNLVPMLTGLRDPRLVQELLSRITERFVEAPDKSRFGLMNAVTSVARDTRNPETRWRLEEFGGSIMAGLPKTPASDSGRSMRRVRAVELIA
jgi:hypothetical protein